ncbi:MAG: hypothetical protein WC593_08760 [Methanoregula sp.]
MNWRSCRKTAVVPAKMAGPAGHRQDSGAIVPINAFLYSDGGDSTQWQFR